MTKTERGEERQVAYSKVRDMFREMNGRWSKRRILAAILNLANSDTDWKPEQRSGQVGQVGTIQQGTGPGYGEKVLR